MKQASLQIKHAFKPQRTASASIRRAAVKINAFFKTTQQRKAPAVRTAKEAALAYYQNYNNKDIPAVLELIADDCIYEDLIYQEPFRGKAEIAAYFQKIGELVPSDIKFVVEDITDGDPRKVGVRWHVELDGVAQFPFSRGVSFYEVDDNGRIIFARDIVEPTIKPGASALKGISVMAPIVRSLGPAADPSNLPKLPIAAGGMGAFYLYYIVNVMLSTSAPGLPVWQTTPETIQSVLNESYNFFYVNIGLAQLGLNPVPCVAEHPVSEALFNGVNAWSIMMWPAWIADPKGQKLDDKTVKLPLFLGTCFLTNVFLPIYMALRLLPEDKQAGATSKEAAGLPKYAPIFGGIAGVIGVISLVWAAAARPEYGDLAQRLDYFSQMANTDRVFWAFCVDSGLYAVWQAWILGDAGAAPWQRFTPFFGMAAWLLQGNDSNDKEQQ